MKNGTKNCYPSETLESYVLEELPEWQAILIEEHLAECDDCATIVQQYDRTATLWDRFSEPFKAVSPVWSAVRIAAGAAGRLPEVFSEGFRHLIAPKSPYGEFSTEAALITRGAVLTGALETLGREPSVVLARAEGDGGRLRVEYDRESGDVLIVLAGLPAGALPPQLAIVRSGDAATALEGGSYEKAEWSKQPGGLVARVPAVSEGITILALAAECQADVEPH